MSTHNRIPLRTVAIPANSLTSVPDRAAVHNYVPLVYGVPASIYRQVLQAERQRLYASPVMSAILERRYRTGLFSIGRPGVIAV